MGFFKDFLNYNMKRKTFECKKKKSAYRNRLSSSPVRYPKDISIKLLTKIPFFMVWTWPDKSKSMIPDTFNVLVQAKPMISIRKKLNSF